MTELTPAERAYCNWANALGLSDAHLRGMSPERIWSAAWEVCAQQQQAELDRLRAAMHAAIGTLDALAGPPRPRSSGEVTVTLGVVTTAIADELRQALADAAPPSVGERGEEKP